MPSNSYLAFVYEGISNSNDNAVTDGLDLANQCLTKLKELDDPEQFPPRLLILLASPQYRERHKASQLVAGVNSAFARAGYNDIPLIGSSVAAVFFDRQIHEQGALLVCLASRLIEAKIAVGPNARKDPEGAIRDLLKELELDSADVDPNPLADRMMLAFFPGFSDGATAYSYPAPELHRKLRNGVKARIPIMGGVSSANDPHRATPGFQLAGQYSYVDAVVAVQITSGVPLGVSIGHGLSSTECFLHVDDLSEDGRTIRSFAEGPAAETLQKEIFPVFLGETSPDGEAIVHVPRAESGYVQLLRPVHRQASLEILEPKPDQILKAATQRVTDARQRIRIENPIACLMLFCNAWLRRREAIGLNIEQGLVEIEEALNGFPCVGGFVDGEAGVDQTARYLFDNGNITGMVFGDEMRERTPMHRGFSALTKCGPELTGTYSIKKAVEAALQIVYEIGFPGVMISFLLRNREEEYIVAQHAIGPRFQRIVDVTKRDLRSTDILVVVAQEKKLRFIKDSRTDPNCDQEAALKAGIISHAAIPLLQLDDKVIAVLQVDLGDVRYKNDLSKAEKEVLESIGAIIGASLNRLFNWEEANIGRQLDQALQESLSAATLEEGLQHFIKAVAKAFRVEMGHIRLADVDRHKLTLMAGLGDCYEIGKKHRKEADFGDRSVIAQAFLVGGITIINDAEKDESYQKMIDSFAAKLPDFAAAIRQIKSSASAVFENEKGEKLGIINLAAPSPWFFIPPHYRALESLGQRMGLLVEHLRRKEMEAKTQRELLRRKEMEAKTQRELRFVLEAGTHLAQTKDLIRMPQTMKEADTHFTRLLERIVARFCGASGAQTASLYLWDEETEKLILRAQAGWEDPNWVGLAHYGQGEGWTGRSALEERPRYIPNLRNHKEQVYQKKTGRYVDKMFGVSLSEDFTLEAIGMPLRIGDKQLGILTLHGRISLAGERHPSGFVTTDPEVLQEVANNVAALIGIQMAHHEALRDEEERKRRETVYKIIAEKVYNMLSQHDDDQTLEEQTCQQLAHSFEASSARFYVVKTSESPVRTLADLSWKAGFPIQLGGKKASPSEPDLLVLAAAFSQKVEVERQHFSPDQQLEPRVAITKGMIRRACIPLVVGKQLQGVIDLSWVADPHSSPTLLPRHNVKYLQILGNAIAIAYGRYKCIAIWMESEKAEENRRRPVQAMGAMLFQSAHRFLNLLTDLRVLPYLIEKSESDQKRTDRIKRLATTIKKSGLTIERPMKVAKGMARVELQPCVLQKIIKQAIQESRINQKRKIIEVLLEIPEGLTVCVDQVLLKEAFVNIIDNATKAMMPKGGALRISAQILPDGKMAKIVFIDSGCGMTDREIQAALTGFVKTSKHNGVGVLIASTLIHAQHGRFEIKSENGVGTTVIVTVPLRLGEN